MAGQGARHGHLRCPGWAEVFPVADAAVGPGGDGDQGAFRFRGPGQVQLQQFGQVVLDALVVGAQGQEYLP